MKITPLFQALACLVSVMALVGCDYSQNNAACAGGCKAVCSPRYSVACVSDYRSGYARGYADGIQDRLTNAINTNVYAAGYWDGIADGRAARRQ